MSISVTTVYGTLDDKLLKQLKGAIEETILILNEIETKKRIIKEIADIASDNTKIPKNIINRMVKVYHKQNLAEEVAEFKEFEAIIESVMNVK